MLNSFQHPITIRHLAMKEILEQVQDDDRYQDAICTQKSPPRVMLNLFQHLEL